MSESAGAGGDQSCDLEVPHHHANMNITDAKGLTDARRQTLSVLGAVYPPAKA
jgi:hypothetical protein